MRSLALLTLLVAPLAAAPGAQVNPASSQDELATRIAQIPPEELTATLSAPAADNIAAVCLTHVNYKSGKMYDMAAVTKAVHAAVQKTAASSLAHVPPLTRLTRAWGGVAGGLSSKSTMILSLRSQMLI